MLVAEIVPPMLYSALWWIIGAAAVLLVIAWFVLIPVISRLLGRPRKPKPAKLAPLVRRGRDGTLAAIDEVQREALAGEITVREAHLRLSELVRSFASEDRLLDARTMTLAELRAANLTTVADAVAQFYPIAFQEEELTELGPAPEVARQAVHAWR